MKKNPPKISKNLDKNLEKEIKTEIKFLWELLKHILAIPFILILAIFGKRKFSEVLNPLKIIWKFFFSAKFTSLIIIINILTFFISILFFSEALFDFFVQYPLDLFNGRIHSLITCGFLHSGLSHLFWNMLGIFIFGRVIERKVGTKKTALIYFGALILSGIFSSLLDVFVFGSNIGGIGASGALMGLVATAILLDPFYLTHQLLFPLPIMLIGWIYIYMDIEGILSGVNDGVGHLAHIGGFLSITLLYFLFEDKHKKRLKTGLYVNLASFLLALLIYYLLFLL